MIRGRVRSFYLGKDDTECCPSGEQVVGFISIPRRTVSVVGKRLDKLSHLNADGFTKIEHKHE